jgi:hypothetical protein
MSRYILTHVHRAQVEKFELKDKAQKFLKERVEKHGDSLIDWDCSYWELITNANDKIILKFRLPSEVMALASGLSFARHGLAVYSKDKQGKEAAKSINRLCTYVNELN